MTTQAQKQEFIGGLVASVLVKKGVELALEKGLKKAAEKSTTAMQKSDVPKAVPVVLEEVKKEVQAEAEHKFDAEPHWQSRNLWGSFVVMVGAADVLHTYWTDGIAQTPTEWLTPIGIILGGLTPLYSRFIAKKPLFR